MTAEESIIVSEIWKPDFDNFQFGDSPQNINTHLPRQFRTTQWNTLPQAFEYKHDVVRYTWLHLSQFGDQITKFIPPYISVHEFSYICFLFVNEKLFHISIRLFYDQKRPNYDQVIEAYAKVFHCPMIETEYSNQLYHEDNETIYFSYQYPDQSHTLIQILRKDATTPIDGYGLDYLAAYRQQREESIQSFALTQ
ncbi:unnamed protein product [Adineta steineri]|uniref:Uncharacterized protein n=1 Tax=Adineta steineri TaxID=433720 RepID=A0A814T3T8_9BILA|nr:unnamed protein product [Adineta steineri]CAF1487492.1 unnamed protein product [Adineta steineri]